MTSINTTENHYLVVFTATRPGAANTYPAAFAAASPLVIGTAGVVLTADNFNYAPRSGGYYAAAAAITTAHASYGYYGFECGTASVTNDGTIVNTFAGSTDGTGINLGQGGYIGNFGTIVAGFGARIVGGGEVVNGGLITDTAGDSSFVGILVGGAAGTAINSGTIALTGTGTGIALLAGGYVNNSGRIVGGSRGIVDDGVGSTVVNSGTIDVTAGSIGYGVQFDGIDARMTNAASGYINSSVVLYNQSRLVNAGAIVVPGTDEYAVNFKSSSGYLDNSGRIAGAATGVALADATIVNSGTVQGSRTGFALVNGATAGVAATLTNSGAIYGGNTGVAGKANIVTWAIDNTGTISTSSTGGVGVYLNGGGDVVNSRLIAGGNTGIRIAGNAGTVLNLGTIAAAPTTGGRGVVLADGGVIANRSNALIVGATGAYLNTATVVNYGTIASTGGSTGTAVDFGTAGSDDLVIEAGSTLVGRIANFRPGDTLDLAGLPFDPNGVVNLEAGDPLSVDFTLVVAADGTLDNIGLVDPIVAGDTFTLSNDRSGGTLISESAGAAPYAVTDPLMTNGVGTLVFDQVTGGQMAFTTIGGLGPEWEFDGSGDNLLGDGNPGFLIRDLGTAEPGALFVGEVVNGAAAFTPIGGLGPEWQFEGSGDFLASGQSEFLIRNTGTAEPGALFLGQVTGTAATGYAVNYLPIGGLGLEWEFDGTGDFLGDGHQGFLIRNDGTDEPGAMFVGEIADGTVDYTPIGGIGPEWDFEGAGDFLGDGRTDFLIRNDGSDDSGALAIGEVDNGQLNFTSLGGLGPEWSFVGTGNYVDSNKTDFLLRNEGSVDNGALVVGSVNGTAGNATVTYTLVGGIGPEWSFHNTNPAL